MAISFGKDCGLLGRIIIFWFGKIFTWVGVPLDLWIYVQGMEVTICAL
jgi:hypothetical protein